MTWIFLAAELGFEPRQTESESVVLTVTLFGNVIFNADYDIIFFPICQEFIPIFFKKRQKIKNILELLFFLC